MSATKTVTRSPAATRRSANTKASQEKKDISHQYGGIHASGWVDLLPASWIPYVQLARLSPPAGVILIYFPHLFGVVHAARVRHSPLSEVLYASAVLLVGSFFCSNGGHAWNDLVDADIDAKVERTRKRPIPRGAISRRAAFIFAVSQFILAAVPLTVFSFDTVLSTIPSTLGALYYPFAKRHTYFPQVVLGLCLTWAITIGSSAMGVEQSWTDPSVICLWLGSVLWVIIFDTIYAHQDLADDIRVGVKSLAVFTHKFAKPFLWTLFAAMSLLLYFSGVYGGMGLPYFIITVGGCVTSVAGMIAYVDLKDQRSCWKWFSQGFWLTGTSIAGGLLADYAFA